MCISLFDLVSCDPHSFPGADDTTLFSKFERQHKTHSHYQSPQRKLDDPVFTILHYAGQVVYHIRVSTAGRGIAFTVHHQTELLAVDEQLCSQSGYMGSSG